MAQPGAGGLGDISRDSKVAEGLDPAYDDAAHGDRAMLAGTGGSSKISEINSDSETGSLDGYLDHSHYAQPPFPASDAVGLSDGKVRDEDESEEGPCGCCCAMFNRKKRGKKATAHQMLHMM